MKSKIEKQFEYKVSSQRLSIEKIGQRSKLDFRKAIKLQDPRYE